MFPIDLPPGTPWWSLWILLFISAVGSFLYLLLRATIPKGSEHRLQWWQDLWAFLNGRRTGGGNGLPPGADGGPGDPGDGPSRNL